MTDRSILRAAARDLRRRMGRAQASAMLAADDGVWVAPDPLLLGLAVECDGVVYGQLIEAPDLVDRLAAVLGDGWEPT